MPDKTLQLLIIEDSKADAYLLIDKLKQFKRTRCDYELAITLSDAVASLEKKEFDAIILDLNLPDGSGMIAVQQINKKRKKAPIIIMTATNDERIMTLALNAGVQNFIIKGEETAVSLERVVNFSIEREKNIEEIQKTKDMLDEIIKTAPIMLFLLDKNANVIKTNAEAGANCVLPDIDETYELKPGELLGCIHSLNIVGCGKGEACNTCRLRSVINDVFRTGIKVYKEEMIYKVLVNSKLEDRVFIVSVERFGEKEDMTVLVSVDDVTEIRKASGEMRQSEEKYRLLYTSLDQGLALHEGIFDRKGIMTDYRFLEVNDSFEKMTGLKKENIIGKTVREIMPGVEAFWMEAYNRVALTGKSEYIENYSAEFKKYYGVYAYSPKKGQFATLVNDITDRKAYETAILQMNTSLESALKVMQSSPNSIKELLDKALDECIKITASKIGYIYHYNEERKEFILNTWSKDVMAECAVEKAPTVYELEKTGIWGEAVRQRKPIMINDFPAPNPLKKGIPQGHVKMSKFLTLPIFVEGKIAAVVGVANKETDYTDTDVTLLALLMNSVWKTVEQNKYREEAEERWKVFSDSVDDSFMLWDKNLKLLVQNKKAEETFMRFDGKIFENGGSLKELLLYIKAEYLYDEYMKVIKTGTPYVLADFHVNISEEEKRHFALKAFKVGEGMGLVASDITEIKRSELVLKKGFERLKEVDRLKSNFISIISHELRTPLTAIKGFVTFLLRGAAGALNSEQKNFAETIASNTDRLGKIINDMVDISKIERGVYTVERTRGSLNAAVEEVVESMKYMASGHGVLLEKDMPDNIPEILMDKGRMIQTVSNLINNAIRFSREYGKITVSVRNAAVCPIPPNLKEQIKDINNYVYLCVEDKGEGIEKQYLDKVFERFYQIEDANNRKHSGSGLGLSIAQTIVKGHDGIIWAESEGKNKGTRICILLPEK